VTNRHISPRGWSACVVAGLMLLSTEVWAQADLSMALSPSTMGPGSSTTLTYTLLNTSGEGPLEDVAFVADLPVNVVVSNPARATTDCLNATLTAMPGASALALDDVRLGNHQSCVVRLDVTSVAPGTHMLVAPAPTATPAFGDGGVVVGVGSGVDLTVDAERPGVTMSASPTTVQRGETTTLTFVFDHSLGASPIGNLDFTLPLPQGVVVADPPRGATDCVSPSAPNSTVNAVPGGSSVVFDGNGANFFPGFEVLAAGATCSVSVDVQTVAAGTLVLATDDALADFTSLGRTAVAVESELNPLHKSFAQEVLPGNTVDVTYTLSNFNRVIGVTDMTFSDDFETALAGLVAVDAAAVDVSSCGPSASLSGTSTLQFAGGALDAEQSCSFTVTLAVPLAATPGTYPGTTSSLIVETPSATRDWGTATATLEVGDIRPLFSKRFLPSPVGAGNDVTVEYTITNTNPTVSLTNVQFDDPMTDLGVGLWPVTVTANDGCGVGSSLNWASVDIDEFVLRFTNGDLAPGASCTFSSVLAVPAVAPAVSVRSTSSTLTGDIGGTPVAAAGADAILDIVVGPQLRLSVDGPVLPGDTTTATYTLHNEGENTVDLDTITFTHDLDGSLSGLVAVGLPLDDVCGAGSQLSGTSSLTFTGGVLAAGATCTFDVTLQTPTQAPAAGSILTTTSTVAASATGVAVTSAAAQAEFSLAAVRASMEWLDDPVAPGGNVGVRFTLDNTDGTDQLTGGTFNYDFSRVINGMVLTDVPAMACGQPVTVIGNSFLFINSVTLAAGESCSIDLVAQVPAGVDANLYRGDVVNVTVSVGGDVLLLPLLPDALAVAAPLLLAIDVDDGPHQLGDVVDITMSVHNSAHTAATDVTFDFHLGQQLAGAVFDGPAPVEPCGVGSTVVYGDIGEGAATHLSLANASVDAQSSCSFVVSARLPSTWPGDYVTSVTTSAVQGTVNGVSATGDAASDDVHVRAAQLDVAFASAVARGSSVAMTVTLVNNSVSTSTPGMSVRLPLSDWHPALSSTTSLTAPCGVESSLTGTDVVLLRDLTLDPGGQCTFDIVVDVAEDASVGVFDFGVVQAMDGAAVAATSPAVTLEVVPPPSLTASFSPGHLGAGQPTTLTLLIDNSLSVLAADGLGINVELPSGLRVSTPSQATSTCTGGTLTAEADSTTVVLADSRAEANATCLVTVDVDGVRGGYTLSGATLTSDLGGAVADDAELDVEPNPGLYVMWTPAVVWPQAQASVTVAIDNTESSLEAANLGFRAQMPAGSNAPPALAAMSTCGGMADEVDGGVAFSGGHIDVGADCTLTWSWQAPAVAGDADVVVQDVVSSLGNSAEASSTLTVAAMPTLTAVFSPDEIVLGGSSELRIDVDNTASIDVESLGFTVEFASGFQPTDDVVFEGCGDDAQWTPTATGASVADVLVSAESACVLRARVLGVGVGAHDAAVGMVLSSAGILPNASATLSVLDAVGPDGGTNDDAGVGDDAGIVDDAGVGDDAGTVDDGGITPSPGVEPDPEPPADGCSCDASDVESPATGLWMAAFMLVGLVRRRRRR